MMMLLEQIAADKALIDALPKAERDLLAQEISGIGKTPGYRFYGPRHCSFCKASATTMVSDDNDVFDCCAKCEAAWQLDPGFCSISPRGAR